MHGNMPHHVTRSIHLPQLPAACQDRDFHHLEPATIPQAADTEVHVQTRAEDQDRRAAHGPWV